MSAAFADRARAFPPVQRASPLGQAVTAAECVRGASACPVNQLEEALARVAVLLREKEELIQQQGNLRREADHRFLNDLQMVASLLSMQARASTNAETSAQLQIAATRVTAIGRIHNRLHSFDSAQSVSISRFLQGLCADLTEMLSVEGAKPIIAVEAIDVQLPAELGVPLGFIVNELVTNALKYGKGAISVKLEPGNKHDCCSLSVTNDGPALPDGFSAADSRGLGMRIVQSFVAKIGGELSIATGEGNQGARFTVLFSCPGGSRTH